MCLPLVAGVKRLALRRVTSERRNLDTFSGLFGRRLGTKYLKVQCVMCGLI